jgi:hypothetical protein
MIKKIAQFLACLVIAFGFLTNASAQSTAGSKVVYHIDDAEVQGIKGLRNIRNHLILLQALPLLWSLTPMVLTY